jgi:hypothetical protein
MAINLKTAGGDSAVWTARGGSRPLDSGDVAHLDFEAAVELLRMLGFRVRNPRKKGGGEEGGAQKWDDISSAKVEQLINSSDLQERFKAIRGALVAAGMAKSNREVSSIVLWSPRRLANVSINSGNSKTGPTMCTNVSQASCPDGRNNASGFRCPLYDSGCYAEWGTQSFAHTKHLNAASGISSKATGKDPSKSRYTPEDVAEDEAAVLRLAHPFWQLLRLNNGVRLHVVGDCVTPSAARTVGAAAKLFAEGRLTGSGVREGGAADAKNVWNYTHGWRDVPRSAWPSDISVLASCDTVDDLEEAHRRGYGSCVVVPEYLQKKVGEQVVHLGKAMMTDNGFRLIPCPHEVAAKNEKNERVWCLECKLCMRDDFLHRTKSVIAFAAHGTKKAQQTAAQLISIEDMKGAAD